MTERSPPHAQALASRRPPPPRAARVRPRRDVIVGVNRYRLGRSSISTSSERRQRPSPRRPDQAASNRSARPRRRHGQRPRSTALRDGAKGGANSSPWSIAAARARCTLGESPRRWRMYSVATTPSRPPCRAFTALPGPTIRLRRATGGVARSAPPRPQAPHAGRQYGPGRPRPRPTCLLGLRGPRLRHRPRPALPTPDERPPRRRAARSTWSAPRASPPATRPSSRLIGHLRDLAAPTSRSSSAGHPAPGLRDAARSRVQAIFGPGTHLVEAAGEVLKLLGHNLPPLEEAAE